MNKTININLAGTFFHIDEDAYNKLQRYLNAIKRSFTDSQGRDEIIADIEARIAELFAEKVEHDRQVIGMKEVDAVIKVMGQPEDYLVDDEIFEDGPRNQSSTRKEYKKLYRDTESQYISGVSSGLSHYLGIDTVWVRLLWIFLTFITGGTVILIYILLWVLVPEAGTTAEKLSMRGKPVNISNIEQKVKEGFEDVADKVKSVDYDKMGTKAKSGARSFFDAIGDIILFFFKIFAKFIGIILIIVGAATLIGLFIGLFTAGTLDFMGLPEEFSHFVVTSSTPVWLISLLTFFAVGIPFFFIFILGLKILVSNLKSIGRPAKFTLFAVWLLSVMGLIIVGVREATEHAFTGTVSEQEEVYIAQQDTMRIFMVEDEAYENRYFGSSRFDLTEDNDGNKMIYSEDIFLRIRRSQDSTTYLKVEKEAEGRSYKNAREHASQIEYSYQVYDDKLNLNKYFLTDVQYRHRDQEINLTLYIPEGKTIYLDRSTRNFISRTNNNDMGYYRRDMAGHLWKMGDGILECQDCPDKSDDLEIEEDEDKSNITIDENGIDVDIKKDDDEFKMKIDDEGVEIKSNNI